MHSGGEELGCGGGACWSDRLMKRGLVSVGCMGVCMGVYMCARLSFL